MVLPRVKSRCKSPLRCLASGASSIPGHRFDGLFDPFLYGSHGDGCPPRVATDRFEQCGLIRGTLTVDGRAVPFDTTGHRDHSWGVRDYGAMMHWNWVSAQAGPELAIHANHNWYQGKQFTNGYVFRDGLLSPITSLKIDAAYDERLLAREVDFTLEDEAGRTTRAHSEYFAGGFITPFEQTFVWAESGHRFEIEGEEGVGMFEQGWQSFDLEHLRGGAYVERP